MKRPIEFYQCAWGVFDADKRDVFGYQKALDAFAFAANKYDVTLSGCMKNKTQALSHMKDDVYKKVQNRTSNITTIHDTDGRLILEIYTKDQIITSEIK